MSNFVDFSKLSDQDVEDLEAEVIAEGQRRVALAQIPADIDRMIGSYRTAQGKKDGEEWSAPSGVQEAYPKGWTAQRDGKMYQSKVPANTDEPGASESWEEVVAEVDPADEVETPMPVWEKPSEGNPYNAGAAVQHKGEAWDNTHGNGNTWEPGVFGWAKR